MPVQTPDLDAAIFTRRELAHRRMDLRGGVTVIGLAWLALRYSGKLTRVAIISRMPEPGHATVRVRGLDEMERKYLKRRLQEAISASGMQGVEVHVEPEASCPQGGSHVYPWDPRHGPGCLKCGMETA